MANQSEVEADAASGRPRNQRRMAACDWSGGSGAEMLSCDWLEAGVTNGDQGEKIRLELLLLRGRESCFVAR